MPRGSGGTPPATPAPEGGVVWVPQPPRGCRCRCPRRPPPQVYWAGPLLGAALGAVLYEFALCPRPRSLAERLAALKGEPPAAEPPPEPPAEPLELKTQGL